MEIKVKRIKNYGPEYRHVEITEDRASIDYGYILKDEAFELADVLQGAIDELTEGWKEE